MIINARDFKTYEGKGLENLAIFIEVKPAICFTMPMLNDIF